MYTLHNNLRVDTSHLEAEREPDFISKMTLLTPDTLQGTSEWLYDNAYSALDLIRYVDTHEVGDKDAWMALCASIQYDVYDEKLVMYVLLHALLFRKELEVKL